MTVVKMTDEMKKLIAQNMAMKLKILDMQVAHDLDKKAAVKRAKKAAINEVIEHCGHEGAVYISDLIKFRDSM